MQKIKIFLNCIPFVLLAGIVGFFIAKKYLNYVTPIYESTAKMKIADVKEGVTSSNLFKDLDVFANTSKVEEEIEILKSDAILESALDSLDFSIETYRKGKVINKEMYHDAPFIIQTNFTSPSLLDKRFLLTIKSENEFELTIPTTQKTIKGLFNQPITFDKNEIIISKNTELLKQKNIQFIDNYEFEILSRKKLFDKTLKNLDIVPISKDASIVRINYKSEVPEKTALLVNRLSNAYIQDYIQVRLQAANKTVKFLTDRIDTAKNDLSRTESSIELYREKNGVTNITQETETDLRKLSQLKIQRTNVKMNLEAIEDLDGYIGAHKRNFLDIAPNFEQYNDLLSTEMMKNVKQLQAEKKDLLVTFTPEHDAVKNIDKKINDYTSYIIEGVKNSKKSLEIKYARINKDINEAETELLPVPKNERLMTVMNREFEIYQQSYNFLNAKKIEAEIAEAAKMTFHRIITPGKIPTQPVSPNSVLIKIVSVLFAMFLMGMFFYLIRQIKSRVNDADTIEKTTKLPLLFKTPYLKTDTKITNYFSDEAVKLELKGIFSKHKTICFSSISNNEGKGFHARHFANELAKQNYKICFIDGDNYCSSLVTNITCKKLAPFIAENKGAVLQSISKLSNEFDMVIINNVSLNQQGMALQMMSSADENIFLIDKLNTTTKQLEAIEKLKDEYFLQNVKLVLNRDGYTKNVYKSLIYLRIKNKDEKNS